MHCTEPLPLSHSWPLFEQSRQFDLGMVLDDARIGTAAPVALGLDMAGTTLAGIGTWQCDLADNSLTWSAEVYDLFGLPRLARASRAETVALYCEASRATMERLRAYAIRHVRGFTLDAEIQPVSGGRRWMRLVAAPICEDGRVVRLQGLKRDVTHEYR